MGKVLKIRGSACSQRAKGIDTELIITKRVMPQKHIITYHIPMGV